MPPAKKAPGRHRHSAAQLTALNELYEETTHPTLNQRTALAQSLGLETKSVSSFFQNRRAATKKRPRGVPYILPSAPPSPHPEIEDDGDYPPTESPSNLHLRSDLPILSTPFPSESESMPQNQRSLPKKIKDDEDYADPAVEKGDSSRAFPPAPDQPSLTERGRRSPSSSVVDDGFPSRSRRASSRRSSTPYSSTSAAMSLSARQRRARPEPLQLDALKQLFSKTPTPSIEERSALALEIGM
ncbi:hypothetical protein DFH09DRAFT_318207 [Mycena vulgaris]|nr:hypothetical protein DFH09DRAFT_318207 [Mycena vulgaris]